MKDKAHACVNDGSKQSSSHTAQASVSLSSDAASEKSHKIAHSHACLPEVQQHKHSRVHTAQAPVSLSSDGASEEPQHDALPPARMPGWQLQPPRHSPNTGPACSASSSDVFCLSFEQRRRPCPTLRWPDTDCSTGHTCSKRQGKSECDECMRQIVREVTPAGSKNKEIKMVERNSVICTYNISVPHVYHIHFFLWK